MLQSKQNIEVMWFKHKFNFFICECTITYLCPYCYKLTYFKLKHDLAFNFDKNYQVVIQKTYLFEEIKCCLQNHLLVLLVAVENNVTFE